jgi:hypothetical protein
VTFVSAGWQRASGAPHTALSGVSITKVRSRENATNQERDMSACAGCRPDSITTAVTANESSGASLKARRLEKQEVTKWWENDITVTVTFCKPLSELSRGATLPQRYLAMAYYRDVDVSDVGSSSIRITAKRQTNVGPERMRQLLEPDLTKQMGRDSDIENIEVKVTGVEKTKTRTYEVWAGVDRIG